MKLKKELFPKTEEIFSWIEGLCQFPHRRTGSVESRWASEYVKEQFEDIGLENVRFEETESAVFDVRDCFLTINGEDIPCFMINGTLHPEEFGEFDAGEVCLDTEIIYLGEGRAEDFEGVDVEGKIVLCDCPWFEASDEVYAEEWCAGGAIMYDPDKESRPTIRKTDSYSPNSWPYNYLTAQKRGAVGFVGILNDYFEDGITWNEDYSDIAFAEDCKAFELPGLWLGTTAFRHVSELMKDGKAKASMGMKTSFKQGKARNVVGELPGQSEDFIIVHSHYDAVFTGAVQDASGMSEVMALAKYYSQLSMEERPVTLVFAGLDGHYTDYAGHKDFVNRRLAEGKRIICDVVIEHIGKEAGLGKNNVPVVIDSPDLHLLYVSDIGKNVAAINELIRENGVKRTVIIPVKPYVAPENGLYEFKQDEVISDAYYSHTNGIPIISILSPQMYLFHPMDKPDMVPQAELVPVGITFAEYINYLMKTYEKEKTHGKEK